MIATKSAANFTPRDLVWKNLRRHALAPTLVVAGFAFIILLAMPYLRLDSRASNLESKVKMLHQQRADLEQANNQLLCQIAANQSLERIEVRAYELGLRPANHAAILAVDYSPVQPVENKAIAQATKPASRPGESTFSAVLSWLQPNRVQAASLIEP